MGIINAMSQNKLDSKVYVSLIYKKLYNNDWQGALIDCNKAIIDNPNYSAFYNLRATINLYLSDTIKAIADLNKAIKLDSTISQNYSLRATLKAAQKDRKGAISEYSKAIQLSPHSANAYLSRGQFYLNNNYIKEANVDINRAIVYFTQQINENNHIGDAYFGRAIAKFLQKDKKGECDDLHKAKSLGIKAADDYIQSDCK